jgi:iron complex transport system substrate-binding protein
VARVLSLVPSATDIIVALGAGDRLVARTDFDTDAHMAHLPSVGGATEPSLERVIAVRPDLVIVWQDTGLPQVNERLRALGVTTEPMAASSLGDLASVIARIGELLGISDRADSLWRSIQDSLRSVSADVAGRPRPSVFYVVWRDPLITTGAGTFIDSLIVLAGGTNVFADAPTRWPTVSFEELLRRDPDVIVWPRDESAGDMMTTLSKEAAWRGLRAVRMRRVVPIEFHLINRPGPDVARAARALATALHGTRP